MPVLFSCLCKLFYLFPGGLKDIFSLFLKSYFWSFSRICIRVDYCRSFCPGIWWTFSVCNFRDSIICKLDILFLSSISIIFSLTLFNLFHYLIFYSLTCFLDVIQYLLLNFAFDFSNLFFLRHFVIQTLFVI